MKIDWKVILILALALFVFIDDVESQRQNRNRNRLLRRRNRRPRPRGPGGRRPRPGPGRGPGLQPGPGPLPPPPPHGDDCGPIPHLVNGFAIQSPENVQYACQPGFRLEGTNVITCLNGRWTVAPRCVRQICPPPLPVAFATKVGESLHGGAPYVEYRCLPNYYISGTNSLTTRRVFCNVATRQWGELPVCTPVSGGSSCLSPPNVVGGYFLISGTKATLQCLPGYSRDTTKPSHLFCVNNNWDTSSGVPACLHGNGQIRCTYPPRCGGLTQTRPAVSGSQQVGTKVTYTCKEGYRVKGSSNAVMTTETECLNTGTWKDVLECEPKDCGTPAFGNGVKEIIPVSTKYLAEYIYQCKDGYETIDSTNTFCNSMGNWQHPPPVCTLKKCSKAAAPNLENTQDLPQPEYISVGGTITYYCDSYYRVAPHTNPDSAPTYFTLTCQADGTFTTPTVKCVSILPESCRDYFERDNIFSLPSSLNDKSVTLRLDNSDQAYVICRREGSHVVTVVKPQSNTALSGANACGSNTFGPISAAVPTSPLFGCDFRSITYPNTNSVMTKLVSDTKNCQQKVRITCPNNAQGMFTIIKRQGSNIGIAYSSQGVDVIQADYSPVPGITLPSGPCDCHKTSACPQTQCRCSAPQGTAVPSAEDSITFELQNDSGPIDHIARGRRFSTGGVPVAIAASDYNVEVGDVKCSEPY